MLFVRQRLHRPIRSSSKEQIRKYHVARNSYLHFETVGTRLRTSLKEGAHKKFMGTLD